MDSEANHKRVRWACRRGMLELDLFLLPFFDNVYQTLSEKEQLDFQTLLEAADTELQLWLTNQDKPEDEQLSVIITKIREYAAAQA